MSNSSIQYFRANTEIDSECSIVEGVRSDYHVSFVPDHSWEKAIDIMHKKIEAFWRKEI